MRPVLVVCLLVAACSGAGAPTETTALIPATTAPVATTVTTAPPSTDPGPGETVVEFTVTDCATPPVTFSLLCEVYRLIEENHVDAPFDPVALAAGAAVGASNHDPRRQGVATDFQCAIPHPAFTSTCDSVATLLRSGAFPIEEAIEEAVASMITLSLDQFTYYVPPALSGRLTESGIVTAVGLLLDISDPAGSRCTVAEPICQVEVVVSVVDGPAFDAGIRVGDEIIAIDGETVEGLTLVDIAALLDGPPGSVVEVALDTAAGPSTVAVTRQDVTYPPLEHDVPLPGVGYLRIPDFEFDVPTYIHESLSELIDEGVGRIVIDLRDNPGGYLDVVTFVASEFLDGGSVLEAQGRDGDFVYPVQPGGLAREGPPLTVVVNGGSASAAEVLAAVLQESGRATVVGSPTFGKDTVQVGFALRNDGELRVTIAHWRTPGGGSVAVDGLVPDVLLDIPADISPAELIDLVLG